MNLNSPLKTPLKEQENSISSEYQLQLNLNQVEPGQKSIEWAAGLFEGEGWISPFHKGWQVAISSTDKDVLEEFLKTVQLGKLYGPYRRTSFKAHYKDQYEWRLTNAPLVFKFLHQFLPYLCIRRSLRASEAIESLKTTYGLTY